MQNLQTLNVVRLKAGQLLSASETQVNLASRFRFGGIAQLNFVKWACPASRSDM